ncbi:MAG: redoxin domain-containing protein [Nitrosarchaeum sp.]|nr:redoxin domain-containing protein [Nitrosarchaeum sp.]
MKSEIKTPLILGLVILAGVIVLSLSLSVLDSQPQQTLENTSDESSRSNYEKKISKLGYKKAPELVGISGYINTTPEELANAIKGKVVLYDIWTYSCINCLRTLPFITSWNEKYSDQDLLIIGIHSPEFEFEKDINNVKIAVAKYGIHYPVVLDNDKKTWDAFQNNYWPRKYIADHEGYIRYDHIGEGGYQETEKVIQDLLRERNESLGLNTFSAKEFVKIDEFDSSEFRTPELYFGYDFVSGRNQLGSPEGFKPNQDVTYSIPQSKQLHNFYLDGTWKNLKGSMKLISDSGSIVVPYSGKEVNIVTAGEGNLKIKIDGKIIDSSISGKDVGTLGSIQVHEPGLYNIVQTDTTEEHTLEILIESPGFEIFTFTFG